MKRYLLGLLFVVFIAAVSFAQDEKLISERVENQGKSFDKQIVELYNKIDNIIKVNGLIEKGLVKTLPYQTEYDLGPDRKKPQYIEIKKHFYIKDGPFSSYYVGLREKTLRIYISGNKITKFESIIYSKNYKNLEEEKVVVVDPTPLSAGTDDITFSHRYNYEDIFKDKKLSEIRNTVDNPLRNNIKKDFLIPNLNGLHTSLVFIVESRKKDFKDSDEDMSQFLKNSTDF